MSFTGCHLDPCLCKFLVYAVQDHNFLQLSPELDIEHVLSSCNGILSRFRTLGEPDTASQRILTYGERMKRTFTLTIALALGCASAGLAKEEHPDDAGAVFVMTNAADKNEVIAYSRTANGVLREASRFETGGRGSGGLIDPLEYQGSLILSQDRFLLFAVNAGSGTISAFRVNHSRLLLVDVIPSGGSEPNALAQY